MLFPCVMNEKKLKSKPCKQSVCASFAGFGCKPTSSQWIIKNRFTKHKYAGTNRFQRALFASMIDWPTLGDEKTRNPVKQYPYYDK